MDDVGFFKKEGTWSLLETCQWHNWSYLKDKNSSRRYFDFISSSLEIWK